jgi:hypothetical protein
MSDDQVVREDVEEVAGKWDPTWVLEEFDWEDTHEGQ